MITNRPIKLRGILPDGDWAIWDAKDASDDCCYQLADRIDGTEIQQFTGILDKNGNEIWEGDFYKKSNESIYQVLDFHEFIYDVLYSENHNDLYGCSRYLIEVVGNIYTHSDMLNNI